MTLFSSSKPPASLIIISPIMITTILMMMMTVVVVRLASLFKDSTHLGPFRHLIGSCAHSYSKVGLAPASPCMQGELRQNGSCPCTCVEWHTKAHWLQVLRQSGCLFSTICVHVLRTSENVDWREPKPSAQPRSTRCPFDSMQLLTAVNSTSANCSDGRI